MPDFRNEEVSGSLTLLMPYLFLIRKFLLWSLIHGSTSIVNGNVMCMLEIQSDNREGKYLQRSNFKVSFIVEEDLNIYIL